MLVEFFDYEIRDKFYRLIEEDEEYIADYSEFNVVDGEEGDYGLIKYFIGKDIIAIKTVHGGDSEEIEFTDFGKKLLSVKLCNAMSSAIST